MAKKLLLTLVAKEITGAFQDVDLHSHSTRIAERGQLNHAEWESLRKALARGLRWSVALQTYLDEMEN